MKIWISLIVLISVSTIHSQIVNIPDANFKNALVNTNCADLDGDGNVDGDADTNNDGEIQLAEAQAVFRLVIQNNNIASLEGIQSFTALVDLTCGFNDLSSLDVSQNINLTSLECGNNQLIALDVTNNVLLERLNLFDNQVTAIDVSSNPLLFAFVCGNNLLTELDLSQNPNLEFLDCGGNQLTSLDVSNNPLLFSLVCPRNQLQSIDVSQNPNLDFFILFTNEITSLDVSQNSVLRHLNCFDNQLTNLDLSTNGNLEKLSAQENNLSFLNIKNGNNLNMVRMFAQDNPNLACIEVDDEDFANAQSCSFPSDSWCKDATAIYSEDCSLGIDDRQATNSLELTPNPTQGPVQIQGDLKDVNVIEVYDLSGRKIVDIEPSDSIDLTNLPDGVYLLQFQMGAQIITKKVVKR